MSKINLEEIAEAIEADEMGYATRPWQGRRLYIKLRGRDLGYITEDDDGSTGTCRHVARSGHIASIIRRAIEEGGEA